ncbi:MAG: FHA domain-containing protein [Polyangiaceae bacterium]
MQFRLRYRAHDLELPLGEFVIGRSDDCQLALDDPLVSRRHAALRVSSRSVSIADLGSRNGVSVNGEKVQGEKRLKHNDRVTIGGQEMILSEVTSEDMGVATRTLSQTLGDISLAEVHRALASGVAEEPTHVPAPFEGAQGRSSTPAATRSSQPDGRLTDAVKDQSRERPVASQPKLVATFRLLSGMADKALGLGKPDEAERLLGPVLHEVLEAQRKKALDGPTAEQVTTYALKLASLSQKGAWVDYVFELHSVGSKLLSQPVVDELHGVVRKVKSVNLRLLRDYIAQMRERAGSFSPTERFTFQRLEGLEQIAALK